MTTATPTSTTTTETNLQIEKIIEEVRRLAAESPNTHRGCSYFSMDFTNEGKVFTPYCIYGVALTNLGVPQEELQRCADNGAGGEVNIGKVLSNLQVARTLGQEKWCNATQSNQDNNYSWSAAVRLADEEFPL